MTHSPSAVQTHWMETLQAGFSSSATLTLQASAPMPGNSNWAITKPLLSDGVNTWKKKLEFGFMRAIKVKLFTLVLCIALDAAEAWSGHR